MADPLLWEDLNAMDPHGAALRSGSRVTGGGTYEIDIFNRTFCINCAGRNITLAAPSFTGSHDARLELPLLKYMAGAQPLSGEPAWASPRDLPGGAQFFTGTHAVPVKKIIAVFGEDRDRFSAACLKLGGSPVSYGDAGFVLRLFPRFPVQVLLWLGDDEFPPRASMLVDKNAHLQMPLDAILSALAYVEYSIVTAK